MSAARGSLWTVYILWGSTYLGIELAGETIPPVFAAGIRFTLVGVVLIGWLLARHGTAPFRLGWARAGSTVLCGLLLIGANALLFVAERRVPIGLASLIFASVPLWLVVLRSTHRRPAAARVARRDGGRVRRRRPPPAARRGRRVVGVLLVVAAALSWAIGTFLSSRLPMPGDALTTAGDPGAHGRPAPDPARAWRSPTASRSTRPTGRPARSSGCSTWSCSARSSATRRTSGCVANVPLGTVATYAYVNPLVAILLGVVFLDEVVTWRIAAGAAVILTSVAVVIRSEVPRRPAR